VLTYSPHAVLQARLSAPLYSLPPDMHRVHIACLSFGPRAMPTVHLRSTYCAPAVHQQCPACAPSVTQASLDATCC
jgi:hypothetical protein